MKTTQSHIIIVIGGKVETSKTIPPNVCALLSKRQDRRYRNFESSVTTAELANRELERMKQQHGGIVSRAGTGSWALDSRCVDSGIIRPHRSTEKHPSNIKELPQNM